MQLQKKQTSLVILTAMAGLIFIWQLIELFTHDIAAAPPKISPTTWPSSMPSNNPPNTETALPKMTDMPAAPLTPDEQAFQELLHRYQIAKLQHRLMDEELAIAQAEHAIHALHPSKTYSEESPATPKSSLQLKYLGKQHERWSATVAFHHHLHLVSPGLKLSPSLTVERIDENGVVLRSKKHLYQLDFSGLTIVETFLSPKPVVNEPKTLPENLAPQPAAPAVTAVVTPTLPVTLPTEPTAPQQLHNPSLDETVLLAMPGNSFTLHLADSENPERLQKLAKHYHIKNQSFVYARHCPQGVCFSLVYGDFLTLPAAKSAYDALPEALRQTPPLIRKLSYIQKEIRGFARLQAAPN